jgi:predicted permease
MRRWRAFAVRLAALFGYGRSDREITEELDIHRQMMTDEFRGAGMDDAAAARAAAVACGSLENAAAEYRDRRGLPWIENWGRDGRLAMRALCRTPGVFVSMIVILGFGVGINTALATVLQAVVWSPLPVADPFRVVRLTPTYAGDFPHQVLGGEAQFSFPDFVGYRDAAHTLDHAAVMTQERMTWRQQDGARKLSAVWVSGEYFRTLGLSPTLGRTLSAADAREPVAVISHRLWREAFDGQASVIGRTLALDRSLYTIVGVAPESFTGTDVQPADVWVPLELTAAEEGLRDRLQDRRTVWLRAIGHLAPAASASEASAEATAIVARLDGLVPRRQTTIHVARASRLDTAGLQHSHDRPALVGAGAVALALMTTLLLVCGSNAAGLMLARGVSRQKEIALRLALGAGRGRVAQQLLAEVGVVAGAAALAGAIVSVASLHALAARLPLQGIVPGTLLPDVATLVFSTLFAGLMACVFGLAPLRQTLRVDCLANIKGEVSTWNGPVTAVRLRRALVATQVAVSVVLLVTASLLSRSVIQSSHVDPGYVTRNLFIVQPDETAQHSAGGFGDLARRVRDALAAVPGIEAAGVVVIPPFQGAGTNSVMTDGGPVSVHFNRVDGGYFEALAVRASAGRTFHSGDTGVAVVNSRLARMLWGSDAAAIGRSLKLAAGGYGTSPQVSLVIGVVPTLQTTTPGAADEPTYYVPAAGTTEWPPFLVVRARPGVNLLHAATAAARSIAPGAVTTVTSVDERMDAVMMPARIGALVASLIGLLALLVATVGIHGIVAHAVTARIRDIGVHVALGASRLGIIRLVLGWTMRGVAIGLASGAAVVAAAALAFPVDLRAALFGPSPFDPAALLLAGGVLIGTTLLAACVPARRALGVDPLVALRHD